MESRAVRLVRIALLAGATVAALLVGSTGRAVGRTAPALPPAPARPAASEVARPLWPRVSFTSPLPPSVLSSILVSQMSDRELLGQIFMLGYDGSLPSPEILAWIRDHGLGAVKIFGWNGTDLRDLAIAIDRMQAAALGTRFHIPLIVATDQEGGWVRQIKGDTSITAGNIAIGATDLPSDAYRTGLYIGRELSALGVNMDFAPDVDVYTNPQADVIGPRSFGSNAREVGLLSVAYFQGLKQAGIISAAKHYPGHGDATGDSHLTLPIVEASFDTIWGRDLLPYRMLIPEGLPAIMAGHLAYPRITGDLLPATRSALFETGILRGRMGFRGVIVTDDMLMAGADPTGLPLSDIVMQAVEAGDDVILLSQTPALHAAVWTRLRERMERDPSFRALVSRAAERVLRLKLDYLRRAGAPPLEPSPARIERVFPDRTGERFFFQQAFRSVTLIKGGLIPFRPAPGERILLTGQYHEFLDEGRLRYPQAESFYISYHPFYWARSAEIARLRAMADRFQVIIFCLANPNSLQVLEALRGTTAKVIVVSALSPVYLRETPWVSSAVAVYGFGADSFAAGFAAIAGDYRPTARLPISFLKGEF